LYLATSPEVEGKTSLCFEKNRHNFPSRLAHDDAPARRFGTKCETRKTARLAPVPQRSTLGGVKTSENGDGVEALGHDAIRFRLFTDGHSHPWFTTPLLRRLPRGMQVGLPFSLFKVLTAVLWSKGYRVADGEVRELYNEEAGVTPKVVELRDTDSSAVRWLEQVDVDWILLISSLAVEHGHTVVKPVEPLQLVPFSLLWNPRNAHNSAIAPFVQTSLTADPPPRWFTQPGHSRLGDVGQ
jgi:hypothetical protein